MNWEYILDKLVNTFCTAVVVLVPAIAIYIKARAAAIQGKTNEKKIDENTVITKQTHDAVKDDQNG